jgi:hypothetical protein
MKRSVLYLPAVSLSVVLATGCGGGGSSSSSGMTSSAGMTNTTAATTSGSMSSSMCDMSMDDMSMGMYGMSMMCSMGPTMLEVASAPPEPFVIPSEKLSAVANGNIYTATYSQSTNSGMAMFAGQMANSSTSTMTVLENGAAIGTQTTTAYYLSSPFTPLGLTGTTSGAGYQVVFNSSNPYPTMLSVGQSGSMDSGTYYSPGTNVVMGAFSQTYSVDSNDTMTVLLTVHTTGTLNGSPVSETIAYTVDAAGNLALASVQVTIGGVPLNFS